MVPLNSINDLLPFEAYKNMVMRLKHIHSEGRAHNNINLDTIHIDRKTNAIEYVDSKYEMIDCEFTAPELKNKKVSDLKKQQQGDIWSLGMVIYFMRRPKIMIYDLSGNIDKKNLKQVLDYVNNFIGYNLITDYKNDIYLNRMINVVPKQRNLDEALKPVDKNDCTDKLDKILTEGERTRIGSGNLGDVTMYNYRNECVFAVKTVKDQKDQSAVEQFEQEARILNQMKYDCDEYVLCFKKLHKIGNNIYIATEVLTNYVNMFDYIEFRKTQSRHVINIFDMYVNLINGLKYIHSHGIAHMDIKPDNIMVNVATMQIKYIDFGLSCSAIYDCSTEFNTFYTVAPELFYEKSVISLSQAQQADIWSLGVTIHMCDSLSDTRAGKFSYVTPEKLNYKILDNFTKQIRMITDIRDKRKSIDLRKMVTRDTIQRTLKNVITHNSSK